jgi:hypothetical protein
MPATPAPVAYFAFNRPQHTARSLRALAANPESKATTVYAFIDGPRDAGECSLVQQVHDVIESSHAFRVVHVHQAPENLGLYESITRGVTSVLGAEGAVIVLEDDLEVAPCFLAYMNDALSRYRDTQEVGSIHAYAPPINSLPEYYFLRGADCWGWATWSNRWALFERNPRKLLQQLRDRGEMRGFMGSHGAQSLLQLVRRARGRSQSWAIQWHASLFLAGRFTLHPGKSFVSNIGFDGSGTHALAHAKYEGPRTLEYTRNLPLRVIEDPSAARAASAYFDRQAIGRLPLPGWVYRNLAKMVASREADHSVSELMR